MSDLRAAVEGLREPKSDTQYWDAWNNAIAHVLALIPEGAVLVTEETLRTALWDQEPHSCDSEMRNCAAAIFAKLPDVEKE